MASEQRHPATDGAAAHDDSGALVASRQLEGYLCARIPTALAGRDLPPATGRLRPQDYDREVAAQRLAATRPQPPGYRATALLTLILPGPEGQSFSQPDAHVENVVPDVGIAYRFEALATGAQTGAGADAGSVALTRTVA